MTTSINQSATLKELEKLKVCYNIVFTVIVYRITSKVYYMEFGKTVEGERKAFQLGFKVGFAADDPVRDVLADGALPVLFLANPLHLPVRTGEGDVHVISDRRGHDVPH